MDEFKYNFEPVEQQAQKVPAPDGALAQDNAPALISTTARPAPISPLSKQSLMRGTLMTTSNVASDRAAKDYELMKKYNLPARTVQTQRDLLQRKEDQYKYDFDTLERDNPAVSDILADPKRAPIIRDDVDNMAYLEKVGRNLEQSVYMQTKGDDLSGLSFKYLKNDDGADSFDAKEWEIWSKTGAGGSIDYKLDFAGRAPGHIVGTAAQMVDLLAEPALAGGAYVAARAGIGFFTGGRQGAAVAAAGSLPSAAKIVGIGSTVKAFSTEYGYAFREYVDFKDEAGNRINKEAAAGAAFVTGVISGSLDRLSLGKIASNFPGADRIFKGSTKDQVKELLKTASAREAFTRIGRSMIESGIVEGSTEVLQQWVSVGTGEVLKKLQGEEFKSILDEKDPAKIEAFWKSFAEESVAALEGGVIGGAAIGGAGRALSEAGDAAARNYQYNHDQKKIDELKGAARQAQTSKTSPSVFEDFVKTTTGGNVYMEGSKVRELMQSMNDEQRNEFERLVPEVQEQIEEATRLGGDVIIPTYRIANMFANSDQFDSLQPLMRLHDDARTIDDVREDYFDRIIPELDRTETETEQERAQLDRVGSEFEERIYEGSVKSGKYDPSSARAVAQYQRKVYETIYQTAGGKAAQDALNIEVEKIATPVGPYEIRDAQRKVNAPDATDKAIDDFRAAYNRRNTLYEGNQKRLDTLFERKKAEAQKLSEETGQPYVEPKKPKSRRKSKFMPIGQYITGTIGGIKPDSFVANELARRDITPQTQPWLFSKRGRTDLDNLVASELVDYFNGEVQPEVSDSGNVSQQWIIDQIANEVAGNPSVTQPTDEADVAYENFMRYLDELGLDPDTATNDQIKQAIRAYEAGVRALPEPAIENPEEVAALTADELDTLDEIEAEPIISQDTPIKDQDPAAELLGDQMPAAPIENIEDFGEKIHGARKDVWGQWSDTMRGELPDDITEITLSKHFPNPDYAALVENGLDVAVLAAIKAMRDTIPAKPRKPYKLKQWAEQVIALRNFSNDLLSGDVQVEDLISRLYGTGKGSMDKLAGQIEMYRDLGYPLFTKADGYDVYLARYSMYGGVKYSPAKALWTLKTPKGFPKAYETQSEAVKALREMLELQPSDKTTRQTKLDIYMVNRTREVIIGKKTGTGKYVDLKGGFKTYKEAREYLNENEKVLLVLLEKKKEIRSFRRDRNAPRVGKNYRQDAPITAERFASEFGFRGVQFGNYVEQERRQQDLNDAYDALLDMAELLGVPPRAISLNGTLGLAFGARGKGGKDAAAAHFESGQVVINLTKMRGAGSLAHEWWHALDNYFGKQEKTDFLTNVSGRPQSIAVRPEVRLAWDEVKRAIIKDTGVYKRSKELDKTRTKDYWSTDIEMTARVFEAYIVDRLQAEGNLNEYLANIITPEASAILDKDQETDQPYPYPTQEEMATLRPKLDALFQTIKTRETDKGTLELFQSAPDTQSARPETLEELQGLLVSTEYGGVETSMYEQANGDILVGKIVVDEDLQKQGYGTKAMESITEYADRKGVRVLLTPSTDFGGTSVGRLESFYKRFGFVKNKGRNKDFSTKERMIREPKDILDQSYDARILYQAVNDTGFGLRSALVTAAQNVQQVRGSGDQMLGILKNTAGVKEEEIAWTGLDEFLKGKERVTRDEIVQYLEANQVQIEEVTLGENGTLFYIFNDGTGQQKGGAFRSQQEAQQYIDDNLRAGSYSISTTGSPEGDTKFSQYTLAGGENYREVLLTLPSPLEAEYTKYEKELLSLPQGSPDRVPIREKLADLSQKVGEAKLTGKQDFKSGHYDQENILAHVRLNDRVDAEGKKVLFIEEIQSDWHQAGRKRGYTGDKSVKVITELPEGYEVRESVVSGSPVWKVFNPDGQAVTAQTFNREGAINAAINQLNDIERGSNLSTVPNAPFKKSWHEMAFRRVVQMAAQGGYDRVAWTTGEQQNDRYDLSKQLDRVMYWAMPDGTYGFSAFKKGSTSDVPDIKQNHLQPSQLEDFVGKDLAQKIINKENPTNMVRETQYGEFSGLDLKIGGEGMKGFYDNILVKYANKFGKKFGAQVGDRTIMLANYDPKTKQATDTDDTTLDPKDIDVSSVHSLDITPEMRDAAARGYELFQQGARGSVAFTPEQTIINIFDGADKSVIFHEGAHIWLDIIRKVYSHPDASPEARKELDVLYSWWSKNAEDLYRDMKGYNIFNVKQRSDGLFDVRSVMGTYGVFETQEAAQAEANKLRADAMAEVEANGGIDFVKAFVESRAAPQTDGEAMVYVAMEEYFARGNEAYILKGQPPSIDMIPLMQRFRQWMVGIYGIIKNTLRVKLDKDIEGFFDRMVATDAEIEAMQNNPLFRADQNVLRMLTKAEQEDYIKMNERSEFEKRNELLRKAVRQYERQYTDWWKEEFEGFKKTISMQVEAEPVYRAIEAARAAKMSRSLVRNVIGETAIKKLPKGILIDGKGLDPAMVADLSGFKSHYEMLMAMAITPPINERVEQLAREQMIKVHGDMLRDGTMQDEALRVAINASRGDVVAYELRILYRQFGATPPPRSAFIARAQQLLGNQKIGKVRPSGYYNNMIKAARETGKALGRKDYEKAAEWKAKQLLNHELYREAMAAKDGVTKSLKKFRDLLKRPGKGQVKLDEDYRQRIVALLDSFDLGPRMSEAKRTRLEMKALAEWAQMKERAYIYDADNNLVENPDFDGLQLAIPPELEAAMAKTNYQDMTVDEFSALRDTILSLAHQGQIKRKFMLDGQVRDRDEVIQEYLDSLEVSGPVKKPVRIGGSSGRKLRDFGASLIKMRTHIREGDGFKDEGIGQRAIMTDLDVGADKEIARRKQEGELFHQIITKYYNKKELAAMGGDYNLLAKGSVMKFDGISDSLTHEERLVFALNWGNAGNREALLHGYSLNEEQAMSVLGSLSEKDFNFVQEVWDYIDRFWPEISDLEKRSFGIAPEKVPAAPFTIISADGKKIDLRGGYYPIAADPNKSAYAKEQKLEDDMKAMVGHAGAQTKRGHTINRVGVNKLQKRPLLMTLNVIPNHVNSVIHDLYMREPVMKAYKLLRDYRIRQELESRLGLEAYSQIDLAIRDLAQGDSGATDLISKLELTIRSNASTAYMGFSISTFITQITGINQSAVALGKGGSGYKWIAKGLRTTVLNMINNGDLFAASKSINEKSLFMTNRHETFNRDIRQVSEAWRSDPMAVVPPRWRQIMMYHIMTLQKMVDVIVWNGAYEKAMSEGKDESQSVRFADNTVRGQASGLMQDLAGIERGTINENTRQSPFIKTATMMYSYFGAKLNIAYEKYKTTDFRDPSDIGAFGIDMMMLVWLDALVTGLILDSLPSSDEDDEESLESVGEWAFWFVQQPVSMVPVLRDAVSAAGGFTQSTPMNELFNKFGNMYTQLSQAELDKSLVKSVIGFAGLATGIPSTMINRTIDLFGRMNDGEELEYIDFVRTRRPEDG